jgi:sulfur carrier protein
MQRVHVNGIEKEIGDSTTLLEILKTVDIQSRSFAVALNSEIVPRSQLEKVRVRNGDKIEVVRAVGGG